jgi:hypothetical protein
MSWPAKRCKAATIRSEIPAGSKRRLTAQTSEMVGVGSLPAVAVLAAALARPAAAHSYPAPGLRRAQIGQVELPLILAPLGFDVAQWRSTPHWTSSSQSAAVGAGCRQGAVIVTAMGIAPLAARP